MSGGEMLVSAIVACVLTAGFIALVAALRRRLRRR
jgi:hypothetical protein